MGAARTATGATAAAFNPFFTDSANETPLPLPRSRTLPVSGSMIPLSKASVIVIDSPELGS